MPFRSSPLLAAARPAASPTDARATMPERTQRAAALLLRAPVATVCLLDDGPRGALPWGAAPPAGLPCAVTPAAPLHAEVMRRQAPLVIDDARTVHVPAFAAALQAQAWQSFVAVPLVTAAGVVRGVLAVADVVPRAWRSDEVASLADLASLAADAHGATVDEGARWVRDVAQREAQGARRKSEQWLALVFNSTSDLTFLMSVEERGRYRCVAVNDSYLAITGYAESEVVGRELGEILPPVAARRAAAFYAEAVRTGEPLHYEEFVQLPVGVLQIETRLTPIVEDDGRCTYLLGVARDVTARRRAEDELRAAKEDAELARAAAEAACREAERASQAKSDFLSRMSHELRTPLNSVIGFANVLRANRGGRFDERELGYVARVAANGEHLLALVDDLLDLARIDAGRMSLVPCAVPVGALVRSTVASFEAELAELPVTLSAEVPAGVGRIDADPTRLQQVLTTLVAHALRRTPRGIITVRVIADERTGQPLRLEVQDTGAAIPADRLAALFEPFDQPGAAGTAVHGRSGSGSGLGLALCRSLCQHMGFALVVRSGDAIGSTFAIDLAPTGAPVAPAAPVEAAPAAHPRGPRLVAAR